MPRQFSMIKSEGSQINFAVQNNPQFHPTLCTKMSNQYNFKALICIIKTATAATVDFKIITMINQL